MKITGKLSIIAVADLMAHYTQLFRKNRVVSHFGGAENLILVVEDKLPEPRANEVRVKIHYIKLFSYPRYIMKAATILSCILLIIKNQSKDNGLVNLCWDKIVDTLTNTCSFRIK
jgi:hypothetical protein